MGVRAIYQKKASKQLWKTLSYALENRGAGGGGGGVATLQSQTPSSCGTHVRPGIWKHRIPSSVRTPHTFINHLQPICQNLELMHDAGLFPPPPWRWPCRIPHASLAALRYS